MSPFFQNLHELDQNLTLAINSLHVHFMDPAVVLFSDIKFWVPMYIIVGAFMVMRLGWKKGGVIIISIALTFAISDQLANLVKDSVARLRPCYSTYMLDNGLHMLEKRGGLYGFYSAHAANAFGFAVCSIIGLRNDSTRKYRLYSFFILLWAAFVGISRILAGKHYFGDVLVGAFAGIMTGILIAMLARMLIHKTLSEEKPAAQRATET